MQRAVLLSGIAILAQLALFPNSARVHVGTGIAIDRHGQVYFADTVHNRIWKIPPGRDRKATLVAAGIHTDLLLVDEDGNLYVQNDRPSPEAIGDLLKITPEGRITQAIGPGERGLGRVLTLDRQGNICFLRSDLEGQRGAWIFKRTPQGQVLLVARSGESHAEGKDAEAKFTSVNSSTWGADGSLYVRDGNTIRKVAPDGSISTLADATGAAFVGNEESDLRRTLGLAVDAAGNVYVAHYWKRSVFRITPGGEASTVARSGWPWLPTGVAVAGSHVYFLERIGHPYGLSAVLEVSGVADIWGNPRVRKISPEGKVTTLASVRGEKWRAVMSGALVLGLLALLFAFFFVVRRIRSQKLP